MIKVLVLKLNKLSKNTEGFTLIEVLVVLILIGILSAIALPSFLNSTGKARQSEAKTYLGTVTRAQQAYYTEHGEWASNFKDLGVAFPENTNNYEYSTEVLEGGKGALAIAKPVGNATYKGYAGVSALVNTETNPAIVTAICESEGTGQAANLDSSNVAVGETEIVCTNGAIALK